MNRRAASLVFSFLFGVVVAASGSKAFHLAARVIFPAHRTEIARITSPDGRVDAVAERVDCGTPCSSLYALSIVPKGAAYSTETAQQVFLADDVVNPRLKWSESRVLEIVCDKAVIENFRNVAYPLARSGDVESWRYTVDVLLSAPSPAGCNMVASTPSHR